MKKLLMGVCAGLVIWMVLLSTSMPHAYAIETDNGSAGKKPSISKDQVKETKEESYIHTYENILRTMKERMSGAPKTGDPTIDFLYEMIPHHEAAISMSENVLAYDAKGNAEIKQLAEFIIREQTDGVTRMKNLLERIKNSPEIDIAQEEAYLKGYEEAFKVMIAHMEAVKPTGNIDKDFLEEMIPHHEGAVRMAENVLKFTMNDELRQISSHIVASQSIQLEHMKKLVLSLK